MSEVDANAFLDDCLYGLAQTEKAIPSKWLYDETGAAFFAAICEADEYYPSRIESFLLIQATQWLAQHLADGSGLWESGGGAGRKTSLLLEPVPGLTDREANGTCALQAARASAVTAADCPSLSLFPLSGDVLRLITIDPAVANEPRLGFCPGSSLGDLAPDAAIAFLVTARGIVGPGGRLLIGVDLVKNSDLLLAAYDDAAGITAAFNLNLLARMNRQLDCDIDTDAFSHRAVWNSVCSRIEMHLVSRRAQEIVIGDRRFSLAPGDTICTRHSYKLSDEILTDMFRVSGWTVERQWINDEPSYALIMLNPHGANQVLAPDQAA